MPALRPLSSLVEAISRLPQQPAQPARATSGDVALLAPPAFFVLRPSPRAPDVRGENGREPNGQPEAAAGEDTVLVYGTIGNSGRGDFERTFEGGVSPEEVVAAIRRIRDAGRAPTVRMDSPGGSVFGAASIASAVEETGASVHIDGLCVSAGILVLLGAEARTASPAARLMVHEASLTAHGTAAQLLEAAAVVADIDSIFVERLVAMTSLDEAAAREAMLRHAWYSPAAAAAIGLVSPRGGPPAADGGEPTARAATVPAPAPVAVPATVPAPAPVAVSRALARAARIRADALRP